MKDQASIKQNFIMNILLMMSSIVFPLISFPYVSRILLPEGTGKVAFAVSVVGYFSMFAQLGISVYGIKACVRVRDDKEELSRTVQEILLINIFTCLIVCVFFAAALTFVPRIKEDRTLFLLIGLLIPFNMLEMEWLYKGLEKFTYISIRTIIFKGIAVISMFCLVHNRDDYVIYGFLSIFASLASSACNFINLRKLVFLKPVLGYNLRRHIRPILVFFAMTGAVTIYTGLSETMLGFLSTDTQVGYYHAAFRIKTLLISVVTALGGVLFPRAIYYVENGMQWEFISIVRKAMHFVCVIAPFAAVYMILFAREGVSFLLGPSYEGTVIPMCLIMPTLVFAGVTEIIQNQVLIPQGKERYVLYSEIGATILNLVLNFILIPQFGAVGAAIGTITADGLVLLIQLFYARCLGISCFKEIHPISLAAALAIGTVASVWVKYLNVGEFLTLLLSGVLFTCAYVGILYICKDTLITEAIKIFRLKAISMIK